MSDIFSLSVEDLAAKIRDAQITSVEVCELYIERIKKFDKDIKAWAHFDKKTFTRKSNRG
jgi:Asp-tRNA(Asn)/Glu-tRNA(Gln) amidotransferase A subunit family amidase